MAEPTSGTAALHDALREAARLEEAGRLTQAAAAYVAILRRVPDLPATWFNLARVCRNLRQYEAALAGYEQAIARRLERAEEAHLNRGVIYSDFLHQPEAAERELRAALQLNPDFIPGLLNLANLHEERGERDEALALYERVLALRPDHAEALARLANASVVTTAADAVIGRLEGRLAVPGTQPLEQASLGFALGNALDRAGCHARAFEAYAAANAASRRGMDAATAPYDRAQLERIVDEMIATFDGTTPRAPASVGPTRPLFICGMFRSGSTLAERLLAGHSRVVAGGELDFVPTLLRASLPTFPAAMRNVTAEQLGQLAGFYLEALAKVFPGDAHVTDKRPANFLLIGLIKSLFPEARIVHTTRDALDNCLSVYFLNVDHAMGYALDLMDTGHYYVQYRRLMSHWRKLYGGDILDFSYEALVREPETALRGLLRHCGLSWEDGLLDFHRARAPVKTPSAWQVRRPLYADAVGRWRNYATQLEPLRAYLSSAGAI